jgi:hypothetical protein
VSRLAYSYNDPCRIQVAPVTESAELKTQVRNTAHAEHTRGILRAVKAFKEIRGHVTDVDTMR